MSDVPESTLSVLLASSDPTHLDVAVRSFASQGDNLTCAMSVAEALATAQAAEYDLAFVDIALESDTGLALVHHLGALARNIAIYVLTSTKTLELATEAVSLGASGMLVTPLTGDALAQATGEVRARRAEARRRVELEAELEKMQRRSNLLDRIVHLARGSGQAEAVRVLAEAFLQGANAKGVAVYAAFESPSGECVRLATVGSARDMPALARIDELANTFELRKARPISLRTSAGTIGIIAIEGSVVDVESELSQLVELATVVLAFVDHRRPQAQLIRDERGAVYTAAYLMDTASREIEKAKRHGRRLSLAVIGFEANEKLSRPELEGAIHQVVRDTDVVAENGPSEYLLLLPETGALGAHACRRRILSRVDGDRRHRSSGGPPDRRGPSSSRRGSPLSIGVATFPHDGATYERLAHLARHRAAVQSRSVVHAFALGPLTLPEIVDTLVAKPILDAGGHSPCPLDLAGGTFLALVAQACAEARRGGAAMVHVTVNPSLGLASAVRQAFRDTADVTVRAVDLRTQEGCADVEAVAVVAEHGSWVCCGRAGKERFRGVHASDPLLADLVAHRLSQTGGLRRA